MEASPALPSCSKGRCVDRGLKYESKWQGKPEIWFTAVQGVVNISVGVSVRLLALACLVLPG
jgi:hypothetical protein